MGLIIGLIIAVIIGVITGTIAEKIGNEKNQKGCFWWGFWLSWIGIIVVICMQKAEDKDKSKYEQLEKLSVLKEAKAITEEEYNRKKEKLLNS